MPTPFYHLHLAEALCASADHLPEIAALLQTYRFAFLLGHIAPDVQSFSGQTRESTHFYTLPIQGNAHPPWEQVLTDYPALTGSALQPAQAVFMAGYLCHLQADWFWARQIFEPYFGPGLDWETFQERLYLHNVLRSYLDFRVLEKLKPETRAGLAQSYLGPGLPFIAVDQLQAWRDFLVAQLQPGAAIQTVEVFAARQGISAENYYRLINAEDEMQHQVFDHLPWKRLTAYRRSLLLENINLLNAYLVPVGGNHHENK